MHPRTLIPSPPGRSLLLLTSLAACGTNGAGQPATTDAASDTHTASDFVPPTGRAAAPRSESAGEYRILLARSDDGFTFTRTGKVLTDQANVPSLVAREDSIFAYHTGEGIDAQGRETLAVARSADHGENWTFHRVRLSGFQSDPPPVDPDVVLSP